MSLPGGVAEGALKSLVQKEIPGISKAKEGLMLQHPFSFFCANY